MRSTDRSVADSIIRLLRNWWPAFLVPVLVVQAVWSGQCDVAGHAAGHLGSATAVFPMVFLSAVLLWALPRHGRRDPLLWLLLAAAVGSGLVVMAGNVRVVDAIGDENWTDEQAKLPLPGWLSMSPSLRRSPRARLAMTSVTQYSLAR